MEAAIVLDALEREFPEPWLALDHAEQRACLRRAVDAGVSGGALYDALIAGTAAKYDATLVSADLRARPTYEAMEIEAQFVDPK